MHCFHDLRCPWLPANETVVGYSIHGVREGAPLHVRSANGVSAKDWRNGTFIPTEARCLRLEWSAMDLEMNASRKKWVINETDARGEEWTIVFDEPPHISEESREV